MINYPLIDFNYVYFRLLKRECVVLKSTSSLQLCKLMHTDFLYSTSLSYTVFTTLICSFTVYAHK